MKLSSSVPEKPFINYTPSESLEEDSEEVGVIRVPCQETLMGREIIPGICGFDKNKAIAFHK
jgi:hypothetical protein